MAAARHVGNETKPPVPTTMWGSNSCRSLRFLKTELARMNGRTKRLWGERKGRARGAVETVVKRNPAEGTALASIPEGVPTKRNSALGFKILS